jgi:hypothetical protein
MNAVSCQNFLFASLAERLNKYVPQDFRIQGDKGKFVLFYNGQPEYHLSVNDLWAESRSYKENLTTIASASINSVQDVIALLTTEIWPLDTTRQHTMAMSEFAWSNNKLYLWFEVTKENVLRLEPIDFTHLLDGDG